MRCDECGMQSVPAVPEVATVFGSRVIRGTRCRKYSERDLEAFDTVNTPLLGRIRTKIRIDQNVKMGPNANYVPPQQRPCFDKNVALLHTYPGIHPDIVRKVGQSSSGLVIAAYGAGCIPCSTELASNAYSLEPVIRELSDDEIPVVVTTQCVTGLAEIDEYETGSAAHLAGAIIANDLTPESALVKLSWVLANQDLWPPKASQAARGSPGRLGAIKFAMLTPMAGEIMTNPKRRSVYGP